MIAKRFLQEVAANSSTISSHYKRPEPARDIKPSIVGERIQQLCGKLTLERDIKVATHAIASIETLATLPSVSASTELASSPTLVASTSIVAPSPDVSAVVPYTTLSMLSPPGSPSDESSFYNTVMTAVLHTTAAVRVASRPVSPTEYSPCRAKHPQTPRKTCPSPKKFTELVDKLRRSPSPKKTLSEHTLPVAPGTPPALASDSPPRKYVRSSFISKSATKRLPEGEKHPFTTHGDIHRRAKSAAAVAPTMHKTPFKTADATPKRSVSRVALRRFSRFLLPYAAKSAVPDDKTDLSPAAVWLRVPTKDIVEYVTMQDARVWVRITDQIKLGGNLTASLEMMSDRFNCVTQAIASQLSPTLGSDVRTRTQLYEKFVRIAEKALEIHNYALLVAVVAALSNVSQRELHVCRSELLPYIRDLIHLQEVFRVSDGTVSYNTEAEQSLVAFLSSLTVFDFYVEPDTRDIMRILF
ncbi:hypothetical protein RI367_004130 [Sorochytrium milnesiophthora]